MTSLPRDVSAQTYQTWRGENTQGNLLDANAWWNFPNNSTMVFGQQEFDNNVQTTMTNNNGGTVFSTWRWVFKGGASSARTITGNGLRFFDFSGNDGSIYNESSATHVFNVAIEGDGTTDPFQIHLNSTGGLTFGSTVNNQGTAIDILGTASGAKTVTFSGIVSGSGGMYVNNANATVLFDAANTYSGQLTINAGTVRLSGSGDTFGASSQAIRIGTGATLDLNSVNTTVGSVGEEGSSDGGSISLGSATLTIGGSATTYQNSISGTGGITHSGSGTLNLYGTQSYSGTTAVSAGTVATSVAMSSAAYNITGTGTFSTSGANLVSDSAAVTVGGGTFAIGGDDTVSSFTITSGTLGGSSTLTASTYTLQGGTLTGNLGGGTATASTGTTALNGTLGANLTVSGGTVNLGSANRISDSATVTLSSGTLGMGANNDTVSGFTLSGGTLGGSGTLSAATYTLSGGTLTANLGTGTATASTGTTALNGTLGANLTVSGGTVNLGSANRISDSATVTLSSGTLGMGVNNDTVSALTISGGTLGGSGTLTASTYALQGGTVSANLGAGTVNATASTALNGTAAATTINVSGSGNTLTLGSAGRLASGATVNVTNSSTLTISGAESVTSLVLSNGTLSGTGQTFTASGGYSLNGTSTVNANLGAGTATASTGTTTFNGTNNGALTLAGGNVTTGGADKLSDSGAVTVNTGTLTIGGNDTVGALSGSGGTVSVNTGATLTTSFNTASNNYAGTIGGLGGFTKAGSGTLSLSGDASGVGTISVSAGRLQVGAGSTTGTIGNKNVALSSGADLAFNRSDNLTYNGAISGSGGTVTKLGSATLTISNTQTYTGATTISGGTLSYMGTNTSTATTVQSGATLAGSGSLGAVTVSSGGTISPGSSPGTLSVGALTWAGGGNYNWQVYNASGTAGATNGYDTILGNSLDITATTNNKFNINLWSLSGIGPDTNGAAINFTNTIGYTWNLGTFTNGITNFSTGVFSVNTAATNNTGGFANTFLGSFAITTNATNLLLTYTAPDVIYDVTVASGSTNQGSATGGTNLFVGTSALNKLGAGTLVMTNTNTYSGLTTIKEGTISIVTNAPSGSAGALGNAITAVLVGDSTNAVAAGFNIGAANVTNSRNLTVVAGTGAAERVIGTTISSGTADQAGGITLNTNAVLNAASGGTMLYSGVLTGSGNLTISNSGTSVFSAANDYTGTTTILNGATLRIANSSALGGTGSGTTVNSGGVLELTNGITSAEAITLSGSGIGSAGAVRSIRGNNTLSGALTLGAAARINSDSDLLTLSGGINGANHALTIGGSGNTTVSGAITNSTGLLTKEGSGTLILTGANTYSGGTLVSAGTLQGNTTGLQGLITNNARVIFDQSANGTHGSVISGTGVMVKTNTGALTLTAANTQSGGTLIAQGTLSIGSGGTSGSLAGAITNNATLLYNRSDDLTQATVISGTGVLHKAGGGTLTLSQANTYSGATTISNGAIRISNATGLGTTAAGTTVDSGAALELSGGITVGAESLSLSGTGLGSGGALRNISGNNTYGGTITLGAASSIASDSGLLAISGDINGANNNLTFLGADNIAVSGAITNSSGTLVKGGAGTLTLSGNNTYTGATTVSNGATIVAAGSTALGSSSAATTVESGGVLAFSNASGFTTAENLTIAGNGISAGGALRNLGGANTNSGTITLSANATISADSGTSLRVNNINNGAANRQLTFSNAGTVLVSGNFSNMDTTSTFFKNGSGSLVISNTSANTGGAQLQVGQGSVTLAAGTFSTNSGTGTRALDLGLTAGNLGSTLDTAFYVNGGVTMSNSIYVAGGGGLRTLGTETTGTATFNNEIYLDSTVRLSASTNGNALFSGGFVNTGGIVKVGNGTVTLAGNNTVSGDVTISNGTLAVTNGSAINGNALVTVESGALLSVLGSESIGRLAGAGTVNIASGQTLTNTFATNSSAFGGVLTGSGGFAKAGDGTLTLSGNSTGYSGDTVLNNGALLVGSDGAFGTGTVTINYNDGTGTRTLASSGATGYSLNNNFNLYYNAFTLGQASGGTGSLTLGGSDKSFFLGNDGGLNRTITVNGYHTIAAGVTGANNILKQGSGTLALSGTSTFSGGIYIDQGGVDLAGGSLSAGVIDIGGGVNGIAVAASNAVLRVSTNGTFARTITVNGETNSSGVAGSRGIEFVNSAGTATLSGNVALEKAATLNVTNANGVGVLSGAVSGSGSLTKTGSGALVLSGNNTFTGGSTLSAGVLRAAHANALGTGALVASSGTVLEVTNGITLANNLSVYTVRFLNGGNTLSGTITNNNTVYDVASGTTNTLSGFVTGSGGVELIGGGVLAITGTTNNYTGNTTISNGTLRISTLANSNTTGPIGVSNNVTLAGANATNAIIDYTGGNVSTDRTFVMNDGGGTINMASSTTEMTLTGSASGTGKLIVGEGTLVLSNATANSFAPGSIQVDSGATLQLAANNQIGNSTGLILNGGTFRVGTASAGFSDTLGTLTLSASSTIDLGSFSTGVRQLTFANSSAITWTGTLTITNWQGVANSSSDVAEILFGTGGLTAGQLGQVYWANQSINGGALVGGGELVPVPEPRVYAAAVALLAAVGWRERRRLRALLAKGLSQRQRSSK